MRYLVVLILALEIVFVSSLNEEKNLEKWMQRQMDHRYAIWEKMANIVKALRGSDNTMMGKIQQLKKIPQVTGYIGCFADDSRRHLPSNFIELRKGITLAQCRKHCKGYKYLGLQVRVQCFCGNRLIQSRYPQKSDRECNMRCLEEPSRMCGGFWRNSVYTVQ
ncbi:sialate:O-sulfotransferase 2-like [Mytilus edulis]|uniref:sialate:O-sulfotransferase 2-like n=1 Tax=Mytilus edulis TaxID=6550 RepID=UPI0039F0949D